MPRSFVKDPQARLDYQVDWSTWLGADTIVSSAWSVDTGDGALTIDSDSNTTTTATVWLIGGSVNRNYEVRNRITTDQGRTDDRTIIVTVRSK